MWASHVKSNIMFSSVNKGVKQNKPQCPFQLWKSGFYYTFLNIFWFLGILNVFCPIYPFALCVFVCACTCVLYAHQV